VKNLAWKRSSAPATTARFGAVGLLIIIIAFICVYIYTYIIRFFVFRIADISFSGKWKGQEVAVKTLKPGSLAPKEFLEEAAMLKKYRHKQIVSLFGVCSNEEPLLIVLEFMNNGCLLNYLRFGPGKHLLSENLVDMAAQVILFFCIFFAFNFIAGTIVFAALLLL